MKKEVLKWSVLSFFLMGSFPAFGEIPSRAGAHSALRIVVRVYDYAKVPRHVLSRAEREAAKVFRNEGVDVLWAHCRGSKADIPDGASCRAPMGYADLVLKILPPRWRLAHPCPKGPWALHSARLRSPSAPEPYLL